MKKEDCFYLGIVSKKHSFRGEVVISLETDEPNLYTNLEAVLIEMNTTLLPFFILKSSLHKGNKLRVTLEDVTSEAEAEILIKKGVYLPLTMLPKLEGNKFYYHQVIGFTVIDKKFGEVGVIKSINDTTAQTLLLIENKNKTEIIIPLIDDFLGDLDRKNKVLHVSTPEGLIEMYLDV